MPAADVEITPDLVRSLLRAQHPDLAELPLAPLAHGWDNELMRLGDELIVRLPRRAIAAAAIEHESRWVPVLAERCALPPEIAIPVPLRRGQPGEGYPYAWSIVRYVPGRPVGDAMLDEAAARTLGAFVRAVHVPAPADAPFNPLRGVPLADRVVRFEAALALALDQKQDIDEDRVVAAWERCLAAPVWDGPPLWLHGDIHPLNMLWDGRGLCGVIDFGDITSGDPATDLAVAWMCFAPRERELFLEATGADEAAILRGRGWAIAIAVAVMASDDRVIARIGERTLPAAMAF